MGDKVLLLESLGVTTPARRSQTVSDAAAFWAMVDCRATTECWPWRGGLTRKGYGYTSISRSWTDAPRAGRFWQAHRFAWFLANGPIPTDSNGRPLHILHRCDSPPCCNPAHLFLGTNLENVRDRETKGRGGDHRGEKHGRAKLTEEQVVAIRTRRSAGETCTALAAAFGIGKSHVSAIASNRRWRAEIGR